MRDCSVLITPNKSRLPQTVYQQRLEPKKYDIFRRLSLRTIAILDVSPARILAENSVGRFTISCFALSAYCRGSQRAGITKI
jgi:hypothetical protein